MAEWRPWEPDLADEADGDIDGGGNSDEQGEGDAFQSEKDSLLVLIDCRKSMFSAIPRSGAPAAAVVAQGSATASSSLSFGPHSVSSAASSSNAAVPASLPRATMDTDPPSIVSITPSSGGGSAAAEGSANAAALGCDEKAETPFINALQVASAVYSDKIISSGTDLVGICFFGTREKKNDFDFPHVYLLHDLDQPFAQRIIEIEDLIRMPSRSLFLSHKRADAALIVPE